MKLHKSSYAVGLFDGEGCIHIARRKRRKGRLLYVLFLTMANNKSYKALGLMKKLFGGSIQRVTPKNKRIKPYWFWTISGNKANGMLLKIGSHFIIKKEECDLALKFRDLDPRTKRIDVPKEVRRKMSKMYKEMKQLKVPLELRGGNG